MRISINTATTNHVWFPDLNGYMPRNLLKNNKKQPSKHFIIMPRIENRCTRILQYVDFVNDVAISRSIETSLTIHKDKKSHYEILETYLTNPLIMQLMVPIYNANGEIIYLVNPSEIRKYYMKTFANGSTHVYIKFEGVATDDIDINDPSYNREK